MGGEYINGILSNTLSAVLLDEGFAACTISTAPRAATATFLFNCEEGYSALIPGDLRKTRYQAPGSDVFEPPQTTVDYENTREFIVSEVCKTQIESFAQGGG